MSYAAILSPATYERWAFLLTSLQLQAAPFIQGDSHEKWKEETCLDIRSGSGAQIACPKESIRSINCAALKTI
jgi:hypothetical protein